MRWACASGLKIGRLGKSTFVVGVSPRRRRAAMLVAVALLIQAAAVLIQLGTASHVALAQASVAPAAGEYQPVTAAAVLDSRSGLGVPGGTAQKIGSGGTWNLTVRGVGGVPSSGVLAVALNLTTVNSASAAVLTVWRAGDPQPATSTINENASAPVNNMAVVPIGTTGQVSIHQSSGATDLLADVVGYVTDSSNTSAAGTYSPVTPARIFDTRNGTGGTTGPIAAGATFNEQITGVGGVPSTGVSAVAINVGATTTTTNAYLTLWATGQSQPSVSSVSTFQSYNVQKLLIVPVGTGGKINIYASSGSTEQVFGDIAGYYLAPTASTPGDTFVPLTATRIVDTRSGLGGLHAQLIGGASAATFTVAGAGGILADGASTAVVNLTAVGATTGGYITAYASGTTRPSTSTMQIASGFTEANLAFVPIGTDGKIAVYLNSGATDLLVDVEGYITAYPTPVTPTATPGISAAAGSGPSGYVVGGGAFALSEPVSTASGVPVQGQFQILTGNTVVYTGLGSVVSGSGTSTIGNLVPATIGLSTGVLYTVRVFSYTSSITSPSWSPFIQFAVAAAPVTPTPSLACGVGTATPSWSGGSDGGDSTSSATQSLQLFRSDGTPVGSAVTIGIDATTAEPWIGLDPGDSYYFTMSASNIAGAGATNSSATCRTAADGGTPVATSSSALQAGDVVTSPGGYWTAMLVNGNTIKASADGVNWTTYTDPSPQPITSLAIGDSGELYVIANHVSGCCNSPIDFYRFTSGSWSGSTSPSGLFDAAKLQYDGVHLIVIDTYGDTSTSTDDGSTWTQRASVTGISGTDYQVVAIGHYLHFVRVDTDHIVQYVRWDITTGTTTANVALPGGATTIGTGPFIFSGANSTATLYIAAQSFLGGTYLWQSTDSGATWQQLLNNESSPTALPFNADFAGYSVGRDGLLHVFSASTDGTQTTIYQVSHPLASGRGWSLVTTPQTVPGNSVQVSAVATQESSGVQPNDISIWASVPQSSGGYNVYHVISTGSTVQEPAIHAFTSSGTAVDTSRDVPTSFPAAKISASPSRNWQVALTTDDSGQLDVLWSDDGRNWQKVATPNNDISIVSISDSGEIYAAAKTNPSGFHSSTSLFRLWSGRWYGPSIYDTGSDFVSSGPGALLRVGGTVFGIEESTGRISYSNDDGNNWTVAGETGYFTHDSCLQTIADGYLYLYCRDRHSFSRWNLATMADATVTTPGINIQQLDTVLPQRDTTSTIWFAYIKTDGTLGIDVSNDDGASWTTSDDSAPMPDGFTSMYGATFALGADDRLYCFFLVKTGNAYALQRASRRLTPGSAWLPPVTVTTMAGAAGSAGPAAVDGTQVGFGPVPDVWVLAQSSTLPSPTLYHVGPLGGPPPIPDGQTYGLLGDASDFAARPVGSLSDPVNSALGSYTTTETDIDVPALGENLAITRSYNSADSSVGTLGRGWTYNLGVSLTLTQTGATLRAADGQQLQFILNPDGTYIGAPGVHATLSKNADGTYAVITKRREHYLFDSTGRLTAQTNRNGQGLTLTYAVGELTGVSDGSRSLTLSYDANGQLSRVTLVDGRYVQYSYTNGLLTDVRDLRGYHTTYAYDAGQRLTTVTDADQHITVRNVYGTDGRVSDQYDARNHHTSFTWNPSTSTETMTAPDGGVWTDTYSGNVLSSQTDPLGRTTRFFYDSKLNVVATTDASDNTVSFTYDDDGNITSEVDADGATSTYTYDSLDDQTRSTNPLGTVVSYTYDSRGNLTGTSRSNPAGGAAIITAATYDPATGLLTATTDARGKTVQYRYDSDGDLTSVIDPLGHTTSYFYDPSGRRTSVVSARGNASGNVPADFTTTYTYDDGDNLIQAEDPLGHTTSYAYDPVGNLIGATDANSHVTTYTYWETNQVKSVQPPDPAVAPTTYAYDVNDRLATVSRPYVNGTLTTSYGYDSAGQLTSSTSPIGTWTFGYDPTGNRIASHDPAGNTVTIGYDPMHRVTSLVYSDGTPAVAYTYDGNGNRLSMTDGAGTVNYAYDVLNRLTTVTRGNNTFSYGYDAAGHVTSRTDPGQPADTYSYYDNGLLQSVATAGVSQATYTYNENGDLLTTTFPTTNGYTETRSYDNADRLTNIQDANGQAALTRAGYTYDSVGNPLAVVDANGTSNTYAYDALDRLTSACQTVSPCTASTAATNWSYDGSGNRLTEAGTTGTTNYTYNTSGQLAQTSGPGGVATYTYDLDGNQTSDGTTTAAFDAAGKMITSTTNGVATTYSYDGNGRRLAETTGGSITNFLSDPISDQLAEETSGSGGLLRHYTYGNSLINMTEPSAGGGPFYYQTDRQGSVLAVTNANGTAQWQYTYDPYGAMASTQLDPQAPINPLQWLQQYNDSPPGDQLLHARMYSTTTGRFTSPDPGASGDSYGYAADNPLSFSDPAGTDPYDQFSTGLNPEGGELVEALQMACDSGMSCDVQQTADDLYDGAQIAGMVANNHFLNCISGKGSCASTALNAAVLGAGAFDGIGEAALAVDAERAADAVKTVEESESVAADIGHAGIHQFPGVIGRKSQFFDGMDLSKLSDTSDAAGVLQKNGNTRFVMRGSGNVGVDRTTGLPTDTYTVIRKPDDSVLTMFPGTSPKS